ncbi:hypothetical protein M422DRAFT_270005 [Sphaerobolus stellatus SS14]|uniref:ATP-dependent DNA helicase n=1 Tax=Sphaerobolus stellatus (strain SS14) TaxID=990650 RepID=A0A0C9UIE1_SPHS4|nr:hypothetical protein M422DRAFT_270005 [Sphaerobolus stellatus SS14]
MGLFATDSEGEYALIEAMTALSISYQLRLLFIHLLVNDCLQNLLEIWERHTDCMSYDFFLQNSGNSILARELCLQHLSKLLEEFGMHLSCFGIEEPLQYTDEVLHEIRRWSAHTQQLANHVDSSYQSFTYEQKLIFHNFLHAIEHGLPLYAFIDGKAGRGKTFLIDAIISYVQSVGKIVIVTATSAFAALLYPGVRTTYSTLKVPVQEDNELLVAEVEYNSPRADLIWERIDVLLRNICNNNLPFGGKVFACAGDFRQTCPVVRRGSKPQIIDASIRSSPLWFNFQVMRLTNAIRNGMVQDCKG